MPGRKLPDNWDKDTRFDGPEHWGMDRRWKSLFPKSGVRVDDSTSSDSSSSGSSRRNDSSEKSGSDSDSDGIVRAKDTVDMSKDDFDEDDDDGLGALSSEGDSHDDATSLRIGVAGTRKRTPETAPAPAPPGEEGARRIGSSNRPSNRPTKSTKLGTSSTSKARREETEAMARRWRRGNKATEPASSSRVGRRAVRPRAESGTPVRVSRKAFPYDISSSEGEEEFDDSEANITGHERKSPALSATRTTPPRRRKGRRNGGGGGSPAPTAERSGGGNSSKEKGRGGRLGTGSQAGAGRAASPLACDDSSDSSQEDSWGGSASKSSGGPVGSRCREREASDVNMSMDMDMDMDMESIASDSDDGDSSDYASSAAAGGGNAGYRSGRNTGGGGVGGGNSEESRRRSLSSRSPSHATSAGGGKGKRLAHPKGGVRREGGRRGTGKEPRSHRPSSSSKQKQGKGSGTSSSTQPAGGGGGASKRPTQSGAKKVRRVVPAKGDEHGWISSKGSGGGGGGGGGGGARGRSNPVSAFQPSQAAARKNQERGLMQSKINFPVLLDD